MATPYPDRAGSVALGVRTQADKRVIDETWNPLQVRIFIRKDQTDGFVKRISSPDRIKIETIEDIWCRWSPKWWDEKLTLADSECGEIK